MTSRLTPARRVALATVRRVTEDDAYADRAFRAEADRDALDPRERSFAQALAYGAIQRRRTLDAVLERVSSRPLGEVDSEVLDALRVGAVQLIHMDGVPVRAAVDQTVESVPRKASGFVNAVMRRAAREGPGIAAALPQDTPEAAAVAHSHPDWIARMWWDQFGREEALALMRADNEPAESALRVNTLKADPAAVAAQLAEEGVDPKPVPGLAEALVLGMPWDAHGSQLFAGGALTPQSRGSMGVARAVDPQPGERVLDLCAAPGGKATHLAALMEGEGSVTAVERSPARARELDQNRRRLGAGAVHVIEADARTFEDPEPFDRVLLDPPCSALGTLQARPDARWRRDPAAVGELAGIQAAMLARAAALTRVGGLLVYSTCTISPRENEEVIQGLLGRDLAWALEAERATFPSRDGTDGFYVACLRNN
ncbi:MAG: 16S rRNA (cytosine(967)-C(5))-methyltransferase RsmB [Thermoleophilaceae bacterium]|nr:16S rRNA (cytosine(967)-C(5))-methyltransferase RsmB [Thermoleophilaceae bacterium]